MKKKNWMKGLALTALGLMAVSCNKMDFGGMQITEEVITQNAEEKLGITIADGQTWQMTQQVNAKVDVNMSNGEDYKVAIYSNNPILDGHGIVLAEGKVSDGGHFSKNFTCPTSSSELYIGLTDAANYTIYKPAVIENGVLGVAFGTTAKNNAPRRSYQVGNDVYDVFTFPTAEELQAAFPTSIPAGADEVADLATMEKYNTKYYEYQNLYWIYQRGSHRYTSLVQCH